MPEITFVAADATYQTVKGRSGETLMETALRHAIPGIDAECGGACRCATCHVFVDEDWIDRLPPRTDEEEDMLDTVSSVRKTSRLSCQIRVTAELDGLIVTTPRRQG
ncbi:MAG TPA: 2Fe-2S iron-sulfur cluster-binding protein [Beijerinckiaceae bacterium]|nr:2Fe-2S iron-sulfur cluster-binding protein [Beijerinckiaceae bacterium]